MVKRYINVRVSEELAEEIYAVIEKRLLGYGALSELVMEAIGEKLSCLEV